MASKVKKGILYYIAWVLFILVGIFCIFACVLLFNPGADALGIGLRYVSDGKSYTINQVDINGNKKFIKDISVNQFNINGGFTDVELIKSNDYEQITIVVNKKITGFATTDKINYITNVTFENGSLNIDVTEPQLWLGLSTNATIKIVCPLALSFSNYTFNITTSTGSVSINANGYYKVNPKSLNITTEKGSVTIAESINILGNVNINTQTSELNILGNVLSNLSIKTQSSKIHIKNLTGNFNVSGNEVKIKADKILGNVEFAGTKGYITIDELGNISNTTNGNFTAEIDKTQIVNIIIKKMAGNLIIPTGNNSNITVDEIYGSALIVTTSGNVSLGNAHSSIDIQTNNGSVNATQTSKSKTSIKTNNGKITANFAQIGTTDLVTTSDITVSLKENLSAVLNYVSTKGVFVNWETSSLANTGTINTPHYQESNAATVNLNAGGKININNLFN